MISLSQRMIIRNGDFWRIPLKTPKLTSPFSLGLPIKGYLIGSQLSPMALRDKSVQRNHVTLG